MNYIASISWQTYAVISMSCAPYKQPWPPATVAFTATIWNEQEVIRVQPGFQDDIYGIAVDVGTTTVAAHLCHLRDGRDLATASRMNPQVPYGEDLMSRVSYAMMHDDGTERMQGVMIHGLNGLVTEVCSEAGIQPTAVVEMVMVGNTTMHHLLLGVNPRDLVARPLAGDPQRGWYC